MQKKTIVLIVTILGSGVVFLDGTIVNLALPKMADGLNASFAQLQWVMVGYLLSLSAFILLGGSLGDIFGRKKIYLLGLIGFAASSLMCALSPSINLLIGFRILQGVFGAMVVPGALAIINTNFPKSERAGAIGRWTAWTAAIGAVGPLVGGYLIDISSWRLAFLINLPLLLVCGLLGKAYIRESKDGWTRRVDYRGAILAMFALSGIVYGLIEGTSKGWPLAAAAILLSGLLIFAVFLLVEARTKDPMLNLKLFKSRNFSGANAATLAMYGALNGFFFIFIIHLQTVVGLSSFKAGLTMLPVALMLVLLASRFGSLATKYGPRLFMTVGPMVIGVGFLSMLRLNAGSDYITMVLPSVLILGLGLSITVAALTSTVMGSVDSTYSGIASAINNAVARASGLIVIALLGLFGQSNAYHFGGLFCAGLAFSAGVISYLAIKNPKLILNKHPA